MLSNEGLEISSSSPEYGEAKEAIEKEYKGEPISIGFNAQYLLGFSRRRRRWADQFRIERRAVRRPVAPHWATKLRRYRYVVMPMRI